eukprot:CAMPEP_0117042636 /NCGR_PEP_ID=MMETSP0472-20121206/29680_1 /TAXON_ID=693140 ORGANISM="Tiarina fusus, Strain LIS" /NCGR_SAMPLE_ID=MMETSP0472 /ASSEMBLY_ACC=CAM_ASM_000603 /LENGTH=70 /DNA_ID=CAMNT_0004753931 /DNA_START=162 /DNA_END=374 /DNA_ORIENTATION=-
MLKDLKSDEEHTAEGAQSLMDSLDMDKNGEIELWEFVEHYGMKLNKKHNLLHTESQPDSKRSKPSEEETE